MKTECESVFSDTEAEELYEESYCQRGETENRIKEQQAELSADRTDTSGMRTDQLRLYFPSSAHILMSSLLRTGLKGTQTEKALCGTVRTELLKTGVQVKVISNLNHYPAINCRAITGYPYWISESCKDGT